MKMAERMQGTNTNLPYGGLFGDTNQIKVIRQVIADPYGDYRPKELNALVEASAPSVRRVLKNLTCIGLLIKNTRDKQHPVYRVNVDSPIYLALTFLAYAVSDHKYSTHYMNDVIADYYDSELREKYEPCEHVVTVPSSQVLVETYNISPSKMSVEGYRIIQKPAKGEIYSVPSAEIARFDVNHSAPEAAAV